MNNLTLHSPDVAADRGKNRSMAKNAMPASKLARLFEDELKDIFWAEKALTRAIPKMIKHATSSDLVEALTSHLDETKNHVMRLEEVFVSIDKKPVAKKCEAMAGLIEEAQSIMESCETGAMCDAGIISAAQKIEHYEIASYGTLRQFSDTLGLTEAEALLKTTLVEEKSADEKLSKVARKAINIEAAKMEVKLGSN